MTITKSVREFEQSVCKGIAYYNGGELKKSLAAFEMANDILFLEWPNYEAKSLAAVVHYKLGNSQTADRALDRAYLSILTIAGYVTCDPKMAFQMQLNRYTAPLPAIVLKETAGMMCTPNHPKYFSDFYRGRWEYLRWSVEWYELARRMTGRGRPLPSND